MSSTCLSIRDEKFLINGRPTYEEVPGSTVTSQGLLMNARFIQGVFDDRADPSRFARWGMAEWDAEAQTERLIAALPRWYSYGLRAFTVGFQGGGPCFTMDNAGIDNNPFGMDGNNLDPEYARRMDRLIKAADEVGMVVIVSYFYGDQARRIRGGTGIRNAVITASRFLKEGEYTNVIIEVANEHDIGAFATHPLIQDGAGMAWLMDLARKESGHMPVGCSGSGGAVNREIVEASDVILIHGNGQSRQNYFNLIRRVREWSPGKPVVCNEDSQAVGQLKVAVQTGTSWGYYNNMTKQEPPTRWEILPGEDLFFALRMAQAVGINKPMPEFEDQYYLQGFEPEMSYHGKRWPRLASLYPENIDFVEFYRNGSPCYTCFDEPFSVNFRSNWHQEGVEIDPAGELWVARVYLRDGRTVEKAATSD